MPSGRFHTPSGRFHTPSGRFHTPSGRFRRNSLPREIRSFRSSARKQFVSACSSPCAVRPDFFIKNRGIPRKKDTLHL